MKGGINNIALMSESHGYEQKINVNCKYTKKKFRRVYIRNTGSDNNNNDT